MYILWPLPGCLLCERVKIVALAGFVSILVPTQIGTGEFSFVIDRRLRSSLEVSLSLAVSASTTGLDKSDAPTSTRTALW